MAFIIAPETTIYNGIMDSESSPLINEYGYFTRNHQVRGADGRWYQVTHTNNHETYLYLLDKVNVKRTLVQTLARSDNIDKVTTASGIVPRDDSHCIGVLGDTGLMLWVYPDIFGVSVFSLWKVNSSGHLSCESAIAFNHGSSVTAFVGRPITADISGAKTDSDPILVMRYNWSGDHYYDLFWGLRLPSINQFSSYNGGTFNVTEWANQQADFGSGDLFTANTGSGRGKRFTGWFLPTADGTTRWYYYVGPEDCDDSFGKSSFIYTNAGTYGNQLLGYITVGKPNFTPSAAWSPTTTRTVDMNIIVDTDGVTPFFPVNLYDADGQRTDTEGQGDYNPAPTVQKLSNGKYMVILSSLCSTYPRNQYPSDAQQFIGRYLAFEYDPLTGIHTLVGRRSFRTCTFQQAFLDRVPSDWFKMEMSVHYDEDTENFYYNFQVHMNGVPDPVWERDVWGMVGPTYDLITVGRPCFLLEEDIRYADFVARYPD